MLWRIHPRTVLLILVNTFLKASCTGNGSLTFLIDDTSSMSDDIMEVRSSVYRIKDIVLHEKSSLIDNMVLVTLNDPGVYVKNVTKDPNEFKTALDAITAHNEMERPYIDCWEPSMKGLLLALEKSNDNSYIFVFTDAPAKDYNDSKSVIEMCQKKQTQIVFVLTGQLCEKFKDKYGPEAMDVYSEIAVACSGLALIVQKNEVHKVFGPIEEIIKGNKNVITTATIPAGVSKKIPFTIDDHTDYVIIYAYGKNVSMKINQPSFSKHTILSTDNAKAIKLSNTKPGSYFATVKGATRTSVLVVGRTDFLFNHGFSESKPKSLSDTSQTVSGGDSVYLSISVTDKQHSVKIVSAQLYDMDGKPILQKLPLSKISKDFYITDPFVAPSQRFKVAVNGIVMATGKPITRSSKIPVTPSPPKIAPKVEGVKEKKVNVGETVQLECKVVQAFPAPKITWLYGGNSGSEFTPIVSDSVLVIMNATYKDEGKYKCVAKNEKGTDEHITTIFILDKPKIISSTSTIYESTEGDASLKIPCIATGGPKPSITWKLNGSIIEPSAKYSTDDGSLIIRDIKVSDSQLYTCEAKNNLGSVRANFKTYIRQKPQVSGVGVKEVKVGSSASIECTVVKGEPKPTITWEFMENSGSKFKRISGADKVLHISQVEAKHAGRYKCIAKNVVGIDEYITTLEVQDKPKILSSVSTSVYQSTEGDATLRIPCAAAGLPKPNITWKLEGRVINPGEKYSIVDGTLIIKDPNVSDSNSYTCEAQNELGAVSATFKTYIRQKPQVSGVAAKQVKIGSSASIKCAVTKGEPKPTITWQFMDKGSSKFVSIAGTETVLHISRVEHTHSGQYKCVAENSVGRDAYITTLEVQEAPQVSGVAAKKVRLGLPISIECIVKGEPKPTITWQFMGLSSSKFSPIPGSDKVLTIPKVDHKDAGRYKCVAQNDVGNAEHIITLEVQDLPVIVSSNSTNGKNIYESTEGDALLRIPCVAAGLPKPTIIWKLDGNVINPSAKFSIEEGTLIIRDPKVSDTNTYTCEARNEVGAISATFKTYIRQAPKLSGVSAEKARIDSSASIKCTVKGEPKPTITWQFMDKSSAKFIPIPGSDDVLRISRVENKDAGRYKCIAKNSVGSAEHVTMLEVQDLPEIVSSAVSDVYESTEGDAFLKIPCIATGQPKPTITWKLDGHEISTNSKYSIEDGTLIIRDPKVTDTNSYTCEVKNEVGAVSTTFKTFIRQLPKVSGVSVKNVRIGSPVDIECRINQGQPRPTISWYFSDKAASEFVPIRSSENTQRIINARVGKIHAGRYKCVAQNKAGSDEHITTLIVEYLPSITIPVNSTTVEGIEGDLALRIPCNVNGVPQPVITWKMNGTTITPNEKYSIEDGALVIAKPAAVDSSLYTCEANNSVGSVSATFEATVTSHPKSFGSVHYVYIKQGETRKMECEAYNNSASQAVKWFVTKENLQYLDSLLSTTSSPMELDSLEITTSGSDKSSSTTTRPRITDAGNKESYFQIVNASPSMHDGNYTCRVSDKHGNTQTHTYVVDVGEAPKFISNGNSISKWRGNVDIITQFCDVPSDVKPEPVFQWTFNGKELADLSSAGVGHYNCTVSNVHGSIQKQFDVTSSVCLITRNLKDAPYMPLVLNDEGLWHNLETTDSYMIVEHENKITFSCPSQKETPNTFKNFPKRSSLEAICKEGSFIVDDKTYKLSDLQCTNSIQPSVIKKKVNCLTDTSELIRVGYNISDFLEAYEVCFDHKLNMPLYSSIIMTDENNKGLSTGNNWLTYSGIGKKQTERGFTCKDASSTCCYSKSQLVNAMDFNDGPAKKSTFIDPLNVIPVWLPCDKYANNSKSPWDDINDKVRSQLVAYSEIIVWSGTHTLQEKNGAVIPKYLWKVVKLAEGEEMAIVYVNDPKPTESDIKCKRGEICDNYEDWFVNDKSIYCCSLPDFVTSFDFHDTDFAESLDAALHNMKKVPDSFWSQVGA